MLYLEGTGTKRGRGRKKEIRSRRRSSLYTTESAEIDCRQRLKEVGIDDEDKESMDEGTMSDI
jgi:adenosylcobinamide amidohydrolase